MIRVNQFNSSILLVYNNHLISELPIYISSHIVRMVSVWNSSVVDQNVQLIYTIFFYKFEALLNRFRRCNITTIMKKNSMNNFLDFESCIIYFILCEMHFQFTNHIAGCCLCSLRTLLSSKALCGFRQVAITWNSLFRYSFTNLRPTPLEHPVTKTVFEQTLIFYDSKRL